MINGICPCGGHLSDSQHEVKTLKTAIAWDASISDTDLPIIVNQRKCQSCGRLDKTITKHNKKYVPAAKRPGFDESKVRRLRPYKDFDWTGGKFDQTRGSRTRDKKHEHQ